MGYFFTFFMMRKLFFLVLMCLGFSHLLHAQTDTAEPKVMYKGEFYAALQKQMPIGWKLVSRGDLYVAYFDNTYTISPSQHEQMPKEDLGKEEAWIKKHGYPLPYEIILTFEPLPYSQYLALRKTTTSAATTTNLEQIGEKYGVAAQVLNPAAAAAANADQLIPDPVTGLFLTTNADERERLAMFALSRELLLQSSTPTQASTPNYYVHDYAVKISYTTNYYKIFPERVTTDTELIVSKIQNLLTPR